MVRSNYFVTNVIMYVTPLLVLESFISSFVNLTIVYVVALPEESVNVSVDLSSLNAQVPLSTLVPNIFVVIETVLSFFTSIDSTVLNDKMSFPLATQALIVHTFTTRDFAESNVKFDPSSYFAHELIVIVAATIIKIPNTFFIVVFFANVHSMNIHCHLFEKNFKVQCTLL